MDLVYPSISEVLMSDYVVYFNELTPQIDLKKVSVQLFDSSSDVTSVSVGLMKDGDGGCSYLCSVSVKRDPVSIMAWYPRQREISIFSSFSLSGVGVRDS